jgi:hypothetical protein
LFNFKLFVLFISLRGARDLLFEISSYGGLEILFIMSKDCAENQAPRELFLERNREDKARKGRKGEEEKGNKRNFHSPSPSLRFSFSD